MRRGLSLLEVMLALSILGMSLAVVGELIRLGTRAGEAARNDTEAQLICESLINEIAAGAQLPEMVTEAPLDELGEWIYSVETQPVDQNGLIAVRVSVRFADAPPSSGPGFSLTRWIIDPSVELAAREQEAALKEEMQSRAAAQAQSSAGGATASGSDSGDDGSSSSNPGDASPPPSSSNNSNNNNRRGGRPDLKLPPGVELPPDGRLPPDFKLPPGVELPPGFDPGNLPGGGGRGGRGGGGGGGGGRGGGGGGRGR